MTSQEAAPELRLTVHEDGLGRDADAFPRDVKTGLLTVPKFLPARHIYDAIGSTLYNAITLLPEYYLTRAEREILEERIDEIVELLGNVEIVELGPGNGSKSRIVLEAALRQQSHLHYRPIDISSEALRLFAEELVTEYRQLSVTAYCGDYESVLRSHVLRDGSRTLVMFLGSSIGNFQPNKAVELLQVIANAMRRGDALLLGADLKKSRHELELAYDDPGGVTAAFNRNILGRINRELGGDFDLRAFRFTVRYDEIRGSVDSFQESLREQRVNIPALDLDVTFGKGERLHTEASYKYTMENLQEIAQRAGFTLAKFWKDTRDRYSLSLLTVN